MRNLSRIGQRPKGPKLGHGHDAKGVVDLGVDTEGSAHQSNAALKVLKAGLGPEQLHGVGAKAEVDQELA